MVNLIYGVCTIKKKQTSKQYSSISYIIYYIKQMNNNKKMGIATNMLVILDDRIWETKLQNCAFVSNK